MVTCNNRGALLERPLSLSARLRGQSWRRRCRL